jgi:hypothetical protein
MVLGRCRKRCVGRVPGIMIATRLVRRAIEPGVSGKGDNGVSPDMSSSSELSVSWFRGPMARIKTPTKVAAQP